MFKRQAGRNGLPTPAQVAMGNQAFGEVEEAEACSIRKGKGGRGFQIHIPGGKGKKGHTEKFTSKAKADKRLRAIQFFKRQ